jgi:uncharacterized membrane protein YdbT with pleckstrin-like domain
MSTSPEKHIGTWYASKASLKFWLFSILTLSIYYWTVYKHNYIALSTRRVTQHKGNLLTANETAVTIENITDVVVNTSLLGQMFGYGDISIQTSGSTGTEVYFVRLAGASKLRDLIFDVRDGRLDENKL